MIKVISKKNVGFIYSIITLFSKIAYCLNTFSRTLKLRSLQSKNICLFKSCWKVCKIKVSVIIAIILEYDLICLNKHCDKYALGLKYVKILNMGQGSQYVSVIQRTEYVLTDFWIHIGFQICQYSDNDRTLNIQELYRVLIMSQYRWIILNRTWICPNKSKFEFAIKASFWVCRI